MSEILGALFKYLVALLGVVAVVAILFSTFSANKTQDAISDLTQLQTGAQSLYSNTASFTSLKNTVAISSRIAPTTMISGTSLVNPWGGAVTIAGTTTGNQFTITEAGVPAEACVKVASAMNSAVSLTINAAQSAVTSFDPADLVSSCNLASNSLVFTFGH